MRTFGGRKPKSVLAFGLAAGGSLAIAACGTGSTVTGSATTAGPASKAVSGSATGTVPVDVGGGTIVHLKKGALKIAILMNDTSNQWEQDVAKAAQQTAAKYGWSSSVFDPKFDTQTQLNQIQNIATNHTFDAVVAVPVNGALECNALSKTLAQANVLTSIGATPLCNTSSASGNGLWVPGTLNWVGGTGVTTPFITSYLNAGAQANPGPQNVAFVAGPENISVTQLQQSIVKTWQPQHPDFKIQNFVFTDFTTPTAYQDTLAYLRAHPNTSVIMSSYSPDLTRGVVEAVAALGLTGKIKIDDSGGSTYSYQELLAGAIQWTTPLFPIETGEYMVSSIKAAQDGQAPQRYISDIPPQLGSASNIPILTKANMSKFKPEF